MSTKPLKTKTPSVSIDQEEVKAKRLAGLVKARERVKELAREGKLHKKTTKIREEAEQQARELYFKKLIPKLKQLTEVQLAEALLPQNSRERQYVINQLVGKPTELQKVNTDKQSVKDLEQNMRGWAGLKEQIEKLPEPQKEEAIDE